MKNTLKLFALVAFMFAAFATSAQTAKPIKLGHLDVQKVMTSMPEFKKAQDDLAAKEQEIRKELTAMHENYQKLMQEYQANAKTLTELSRTAKEQEIQGLAERIQNFQQLAQEQMKLYKKNKIHPFRQILVMFIQFPVFIAVWGAMQGSAILTQGSVFGLQLTTVTSNAIMAANSETPFAIVLIIIMSIAQFISSKLPTWFQNWKGKKYSTVTVKNEAVEKQNQSMKMMSTVMLVVIIFMGFTLPAAMGIYWFIGAIISIAQTLIMEAVQTHNRHKSGKGPGAKISNRPNSIIRRGKKL